MTNINTKFDKVDLKMKVLFDVKLKELMNNNRLLRLGEILFNGDDGNQAYLIFQLVRRYLKQITILLIFQNGDLKDYLMKALNHLK